MAVGTRWPPWASGTGRRAALRTRLVAGLLAGLLGACTTVAPDTTTGPPPEPEVEAPPADHARAEATEDPGPGPSPPADATPVPRPCDGPTEAAIAAPVATQLDALATGDFDTAYAQASPYFRTVVPPERFERLIRDGYPELLDVTARRLEGCTVLNRRAILVVGVTTSTGARRALAYQLSDTDEGWRVDGADDAAPPEPAPAAPTV